MGRKYPLASHEQPSIVEFRVLRQAGSERLRRAHDGLVRDATGFATDVLTNLFEVFVVGLSGSLGLAIAIGLGFGPREYIAENVDDWTSQASDTVTEDRPGTGSGPDGGDGSGSRSDD
jgi:hypothetical protein